MSRPEPPIYPAWPPHYPPPAGGGDNPPNTPAWTADGPQLAQNHVAQASMIATNANALYGQNPVPGYPPVASMRAAYGGMTAGPAAPAYPAGSGRRRWPAIAAATLGAAAVAGAVATAVTLHTSPAASLATSGQTVTVTAEPPTPQVLPAAEADTQTCRSWRTAAPMLTSAKTAVSVIPEGLTITSPEVQANPVWSQAVTHAAKLYQQASETVKPAEGTSRLLGHLASTASAALHTLSLAYADRDPANGNIIDTYLETRNAMDALCP